MSGETCATAKGLLFDILIDLEQRRNPKSRFAKDKNVRSILTKSDINFSEYLIAYLGLLTNFRKVQFPSVAYVRSYNEIFFPQFSPF